MEPLEDVLRKVKDLKKDLSAEDFNKIIKEAEGYYKPVCTNNRWIGGSRDGSNPGYWEDESVNPEYKDEWFETSPAIYAPDTEKREAARAQLQQIYDSSPQWYSAKYVAGIALGTDVNAGQIIEPELEYLDYLYYAYLQTIEARSIFRNQGKPEEELPKINISPISVSLIQDLRKLLELSKSPFVKSLLCDIYKNYPHDVSRREAGKALGYSPLRILAHEHPVAATLTGIATVGAISGLVYYALAEYFGK